MKNDFGWIKAVQISLYNSFGRQIKADKAAVSFFEKKFAGLIKKYSESEASPQLSAERIIWVCWWQGESDMPALVKACLASVRKNAGSYRIQLLTLDNFRDFVSLPEYIIEKHRRGIIGAAHFSDILRVNILRRYGGIWMDATILATGNIPDKCLDYPIYSRHTDETDCATVGNGKWSTYFLCAGVKNHPLYCFMSDIYAGYWKEYNQAITYLMMDDMIFCAYRGILSVRRDIDKIPINNSGMKRLAKAMNEPFSTDVWEKLCSEAWMQKLSYKIPCRELADGQPTNFKHITDLS